MRGTAPKRSIPVVILGIIPAYAGNRILERTRMFSQRDHPRVCGEQKLLRISLTRLVGSSPRMRGTEQLHSILTSILGIIPAYAGNSCSLFCFYMYNRDHPRVCGEQRSKSELIVVWKGSSPRMRGTGCWDLYRLFNLGIIPAYAGNSYESDTAYAVGRDHPRVCGEQVFIAW